MINCWQRSIAVNRRSVAANLQMSAFKIDPYTTTLMEGDASVGAVWGLNANLASPPSEAFREPYIALLDSFRKALECDPQQAGIYLYPFYTLHITCGSPAPFTNSGVRPDERASLCDAWIAALREVCTHENGFPMKPFPLVFDRVTLEPAAGIFRVEDPTGAVGRIRACMHKAFEAHPAIRSLPDGLAQRAAFRTPNIIHATFLRFGRERGPGVTDEAIRSAFEAAANDWKPVTVICDALRLVEECAIYMHLELHGKDRDKIVAEFPFCASGR